MYSAIVKFINDEKEIEFGNVVDVCESILPWTDDFNVTEIWYNRGMDTFKAKSDTIKKITLIRG